MISLSEYYLVDADLITSCRQKAALGLSNGNVEHHVIQYLYPRVAVVIGASNRPETSVNAETCLADGIRIIQRPSGGEAVVISPNTLLFSHIMLGPGLPASRVFFMENLGYFEAALSELGVKDLRFNGISDLCIGDKKILGCAIYRRPGMVLFQAVLNVSESPAMIAKYLAVPSRMPDYRLGRPHEDFVTSLRAEGYQMALSDIDVPARLSRAGIKALRVY